MSVEICVNCGRVILSSERAFIVKGKIVCAECNRALQSKQTSQPAPSPKPTVSAKNVAQFSPAQTHPVGSRRTRPVWITGAILGGIAAICVVVVLGVLLMSHAGWGIVGLISRNWGSPYNVDYKITSHMGRVFVTTTVRGPCAKLAVILVDPNRVAITEIIPEEKMIINCGIVEVPIDNPRAGKWVLIVKTFAPEKVVWQKKFAFSLDQLLIKDVTFGFEPDNSWGNFHGYKLTSIQIALQKTGNLPIVFTDASFTLDGSAFDSSIVRGKTILDRDGTLNIEVSYWSPKERFNLGERHLVKGRLFYGEYSLDFEKEFVVANSTQDTEAQNVGAQGTKPTPKEGNTAEYDVPSGLKEGVNKLSQRLKSSNELLGKFDDYKIIIPPDYKGDETQYEIGFLNPGGALYVFRTTDGGKMWYPFPPTNPYLKKIDEQSRKKVKGGVPEEGNSTNSPAIEPTRRPILNQSTGTEGGLDTIERGEMIWLKCRDPKCGNAWRMDRKAYYEYIEKNRQGMTVPAIVCPKCGGKTGYRAEKG